MACEDSASFVAAFPADCPHLSHFHRSCGSAGSTEFPANSQIDLGLVTESPLTGVSSNVRGSATARSLQTVSRRSEPSSRTALMGEQPNPWEVLPPQDATSRHRAISAVSGGADYLSTLHPIGARGRRLMVTIDFIHAMDVDRHLTARCRADQSLQGHAGRFVLEAAQQVRSDQFDEPTDAPNRDPDPVICLIPG